MTCNAGFHATGTANDNNLACPACTNQDNCAVSTANTCGLTQSHFYDKTKCTSVTAPGFYLNVDKVAACVTVVGALSRTCNGPGTAGLRTVKCNTAGGFREENTVKGLACVGMCTNGKSETRSGFSPGKCSCQGEVTDICGVCGGDGFPQNTCDCDGGGFPHGTCDCKG